jgi:hypothetical protein
VSWHPMVLTDQLTLSQSEGVDYAHQIITPPPDFQTFLRPCIGGLFWLIKDALSLHTDSAIGIVRYIYTRHSLTPKQSD